MFLDFLGYAESRRYMTFFSIRVFPLHKCSGRVCDRLSDFRFSVRVVVGVVIHHGANISRMTFVV